MRLFTAIELPESARVSIAGEERRLARLAGRAAEHVRWVRVEHLHVTLVFLGDVADHRAPAFVECLREPVPLPPFRLTLGGFGAFPPHGAPRVLWLGVLDGALSLEQVHALVVDRLGTLGVPRPAEPYHPHVTLGRWKQSRPRDRQMIAHGGSAQPVAAVDVHAAALIESRLTSEGPNYTVLARAALGSGPTG